MLCRVLLVILLLLMSGACSSAFCRDIAVSTFDTRKIPLANVEEVMREAYHRLGHSLKITKLPAQRAIYESNAGRVDAELVRIGGIEKQYSNLIRVPVPILKVEFVAFTKDKAIRTKGWESLKPYRVGYFSGLKAIERRIPKDISSYPVNTYEQLFQMLDMGRVDVVLSMLDNGLDYLNRLQLHGIIHHEPALIRHELYHYVHKKNIDLVIPLTQVLQEMTEEGWIQ